MNRADFIRNSLGCAAALATGAVTAPLRGETPPSPPPCEEKAAKAARDRDFIDHWLTDLLDAMDTQLDRETQVKLMEACGRGCFVRHSFKTDLAARGRGSVEKLVEAYQENFEAWKEGTTVHIRYGAVSRGCYCPVARDRHPKGPDLHCECTRATHESIFEAALGRHVPLKIVESVRRGGKTCHFVADVSA